jgi:hypothetical protein
MQQLWDRGEAAGYAAHLTTDPLPGTPEHQVLLHVAFGDHQVAQVAAEELARTARIPVRSPALADGRHPDAVPFVGLELAPPGAELRSALVYWDSGSVPPWAANQPVTESPAWEEACGDPSAAGCTDPHQDPGGDPAAQQQAFTFLTEGVLTDTCAGAPCQVTPAGP